MPSPLIDPRELLSIIDASDLVILDASSGPKARSNYEAKHLKGALFVDLETQLSDIKEDAANGGRHPLPTPKAFGQALGDLGITPDSHIVVYDSMSGGNAAARMWWMMQAIGHEKVQVLDGGIAYAETSGFPMSSETVHVNSTNPYPVSDWTLPVVGIDEVAIATASEDQTVIDVRSAPRYAGEVEPIDLIAGHIPGAINVPFETNLDQYGKFLPPDALRTKYQQIVENSQDIVVHCGSGVTACHTLLAMDYAGFEIPKLYVGSWSEWSRNDRPMITKD